MRNLVIAAMLGVLAMSGKVQAQDAPEPEPGLLPVGAGKTTPGPSAYFTGKVTVRPMVAPDPPGRTSVGAVSFAPGARSDWHTHPAGQTLVVTQGCGWTQRRGGSVTRICEGDTVHVPAGAEHWHGATATSGMTHLAITETLDGRNVVWKKPVTDAEYAEGARTGG